MTLSRLAKMLLFAAILAAPLLAAACDTYVAPPDVEVSDAKDGVLTDTKAALVLAFSKPVDRKTVDIKILPLDIDDEGNLPDERDAGGVPADERPTLKPLFSHSVTGDEGGTAVFTQDDTRLVVTPNAPFPVGQKMVVVVEAGLSTRDGVATQVRKRVLFSYEFRCGGTRGTKLVTSGAYFALLDIQEPVPVQIQLYGRIDVDQATGKLVAQFTNADRNPGLTCPQDCGAEKVCRKLPAPDCVVPSFKAGSVDEFSDFVPNNTPPTGYTILVSGCAEDQDETTAAFVTAPGNLVVQKPEVQVNGLVLTASFKKDGAGILRSTGTVTGSEIVFGSARLSSGRGTATIRSVPEDQAPKDIPAPPGGASRDR